MQVMRYSRTPSRRLVNAIERARIRLGVAPRHRYLLTVAGRRTGLPHTTPVGLVEHGPDRWLVAPYGDVSWVRNARAARMVRLERGRSGELCAVAEVGPGEAGPVLREYLSLEPITRPFFDTPPDAPDAAFTAEAADHPVFRLSTRNQSVA
jgi:deazaflavin-dependent oxidoreductase (nitroreductase family)